MSATTGVQHQLRRGTNAQMASFTGAIGEITFDTSFNRIVTHDGLTAGGYPHALATVQTSTATSTGIAATTAVFIAYSTTGAANYTLPAASAYAPGQVLTVMDGAGFAGTDNITVNTASASDTIYGSAGTTSTSVTISVNGAQLQLISNSSNHWILMSTA